MSYIFEALQRAEAERSGGSVPAAKNAESVADLLQGVEREIERRQGHGELPARQLQGFRLLLADFPAD